MRASTFLNSNPSGFFMRHISYHTRRVLDLHSFLNHFNHVQGGGMNSQGMIQYTARCPAHETSHQSLALSCTRDGRYLVHCHAGCPAAEVVGAVGLELQDLYPDGSMYERGSKPVEHTHTRRVDEEALKIADGIRACGGRLSREDLARERQAFLASRKERQWP